MDSIFEFAQHLFKGGSEPVITILVFVIIGLTYEIHRMRKEAKMKEDKLDRIVDDYHEGNLTIAEAMNSLKCVLSEIKGRLG